jgi:hypothetical protein
MLWQVVAWSESKQAKVCLCQQAERDSEPALSAMPSDYQAKMGSNQLSGI